jgi:hypothetical protein
MPLPVGQHLLLDSQIFALKAHKNLYLYQESVIYGNIDINRFFRVYGIY